MKQFFKNNKNTSMFLMGCWILINFLPFRLVTEITDADGNPSNYFVRSDAGFEDAYLFVPQLILLIPLIIMYLSKKKLGFLFSIIFSSLGFIPLVIINFIINFKIELAPPYHSLEEGFGYFLLCLLALSFLIASISFYAKAKENVQNKDELIDQLIG